MMYTGTLDRYIETDIGLNRYNDQNIVDIADIAISVDCSDIERFVMRKEKFLTAKLSICIDHHRTNNFFADMNYIDAHAGATGEIVYDLIKLMGSEIDVEMAEAIYTAITTDTGNFQYPPEGWQHRRKRDVPCLQLRRGHGDLRCAGTR